MTSCPRPARFVHLAVLGCTSNPHNMDGLVEEELNDVATALSWSLADSDLMRRRALNSPLAVIMINRMENLTGEPISMGSQWLFIARVTDAPSVHSLAASKNVRFQIDRRQHGLLRKYGYEIEPETIVAPTHLMWVRIHPARSGRRNRDRPVCADVTICFISSIALPRFATVTGRGRAVFRFPRTFL